MSMPNELAFDIDATMREAVYEHQQGDLDSAAAKYGAVLQHDPELGDALHLLGLIRYQRHNFVQAVELIERAVRVSPSNSLFRFNLGKVYNDAAFHDRAILCYRIAWQLQPGALHVATNLGNALIDNGQMAEAVGWFREALRYRADDPELLNGLGIALRRCGNPTESELVLRRSVEVAPTYPNAFTNLAATLLTLDRLGEAIEYSQRAIALAPDDARQYHNLGVALLEGRQYDAAESAFARSLNLAPEFSEARAGLGLAQLAAGRHEPALSNLRAACRSDDATLATRQAMLCALNFSAEESPAAIFEAHREFGDWLQGRIDVLPERLVEKKGKLRIGYVSPDFRSQSCAYFLMPLIANHYRRRFEVYLYSCVRRPDEITQRFRQQADCWREAAGLGDAELAQRIRDDRIDVLIDVAGHTDGNRLAVFARRPAPVQVSWLGYPNTTGLSRIDYRVSDTHADPCGKADLLVTEKLVRLPDGFLCFAPLFAMPDPGELPAARNGFVTFGSFNNLSKVTLDTLSAWARILNRVDGSRLYLKSHQLDDSRACARLRSEMASRGIDDSRIAFAGKIGKVADHYLAYRDVDIALDPFPYNGTTTTCEAIWMGVPVIALKGDRHAARVGASILAHLGAEELIADTVEQYVEKARVLAIDTGRIERYRNGLRTRFAVSPLADAKSFALHFESALLGMVKSRLAESSADLEAE